MAMPQEYIFASENQPREKHSSARASLRFYGLHVCPELRQICFTGNKQSSLFFARVKEVHMFDDKKSIGFTFDVLCGEQGTELYRMLAD